MAKFRWRCYNPEKHPDDVVGLTVLHLEQEKAIGQPMDLPDMMQSPVLISVVACERATGEVKGGLYAEAVAEICFVGTDPVVSADAARIAKDVFTFLKGRKVRIARMMVPKSMGENGKRICEALERVGFKSTDDDYYHLEKDLR